MKRTINKVAVLGSGVMGAAIAAHFANAGVSILLLDIVPKDLTAEEKAKGLTLENKNVRNRIAQNGLDLAKKSRPAAFFVAENADRISVGNFDDDLNRIQDCDWIVEAIVENLGIKQQLLKKVDENRRPGSIVSSNTSGISIRAMAEGLSDDFQRNFLGTHFFNPPRYMRLLELIPTTQTDPGVTAFIADYGDRALGKGIVYAKDTPNFIANRIGTFAGMHGMSVMLKGGYTIEEIDKITGPAIGHAKTASFRTVDLVGLDTLAHVSNNIYAAIPDDERRDVYILPDFIKKMVERGMLGNKTRGGFYKKVKTAEGKDEILTLDYNTMEYRPKAKVNLPSLEMTKGIENTGERVKALTFGKDRVGAFLWESTSETLLYTARRIPEIADDILQVDNAMKWGFNWELGPFELWDALGLEKTVERLRSEGREIPANITKMLDGGHKSFYKREEGRKYFYDLVKGEYREVPARAGVIFLPSVKDQNKVVKKNTGATLVDIGDGVLCLEFHSKMNSIGGDTVQMMNFAVTEVGENFEGLVIGNHGENFSVGANLMLLLLEAQEQNWEEIDLMIRVFQNSTMNLRYSPKPVVVAPFGMTLGGGCEITLHADRVRASAETYIGLVEVGVGLIPGGGGTKEMVASATEGLAKDADPFPAIRQVAEYVATAKVATSAVEARKMGFLRSGDQITMNPTRLIADAKESALAIVKEGYKAPTPRTDIIALGESALSALKLGIYMMKRGGYISEYDAYVASQLARILTGGDLSHPTKVSEQYLLDLEREVFLRLCGQRKTLERIQHTLKTGKPLRN